MIRVREKCVTQAWRKTLQTLYHEGEETDNEKYFRDDLAVIEITNPILEPADPLFPMSQDELNTINRYIWSGKREGDITHEWTKLYYHPLFDKPNSQIEHILNTLALPEPIGSCQASMWDKNLDQESRISPCTQIIWARKKFGAVELHVHAHSSDAYKKLFMNLQEFVSLHLYIAKRANLLVGKYVHIIDSCHIHHKDLESAMRVIEQMKEVVISR